MTSQPTDDATPPDHTATPPAHQRRKRYSGTHPRQFAERYKELDPAKYPDMQAHIRQQGRTPAGTHVAIMVAQVIEVLAPRPGDVVADCTLGYGSHAMEFMRAIGPAGRLVGMDVDAEQLERARARLAQSATPFALYRSNFAGIGKTLAAEKLEGFDMIFADLGVSSMQLDDPARGFSYKNDGPLDMRMDDRLTRRASDILTDISQRELAEALTELADEEHAKAIAREVVQRREHRPILTTAELAELVLAAKGVKYHRGQDGPHPAAKTFQALRILVNDELGCLSQLLRAAPYCLKAGGRVGVLTFHSGEDRLVKKSFKANQTAGLYGEISPDVIRPTPAELRDNPRARAAKLRWASKA